MGAVKGAMVERKGVEGGGEYVKAYSSQLPAPCTHTVQRQRERSCATSKPVSR